MQGKRKRGASRRNEGTRTLLIIGIAVLTLLLVVLLVWAASLSGEPAGPDTEPTTRPTTEPTTRPTTEPVTEPTTEPSTDPTTQPTEAPTVDPTAEPTEHTHSYTVTETVEAGCTTGGYSVYACACGDSYHGDETEAKGHRFQNVVIEPTQIAGGYTRHTCIVCGYTYSDNYTDKLPPATEPATEPDDCLFNLIQGLKITDMGSYSGPYMEDGTDEFVSDVLMIVVTNTSDKTLQYAKIQLTGPAGTATFSVTTLPAGASLLVLEDNRMTDPGEDGLDVATAQNVVFFQEEPSAHTDKLRYQGMDGAINVTNISDADITGVIEIYYKNYINGQLYGGITYVARITTGLAAGETRQIMTGHFSSTESVIVFAKILQE